MKNNNSAFIDKLISLVPVWGYQHGKAEGFKKGMSSAAAEYEKILAEWQDELQQYNRDVFGKGHAFITPEGWDEQYWCEALDYFLDGNDLALTTRQIFFAFTKAFLQKMDEKGLKTPAGAPLTYRHLTMVQCAVSTGVEDLIRLDKSFLEITADFLNMFSPFGYDDRHKELATGIRELRGEILTALSSSSSCNVLVLGRTGVGKSSLLNYLLGQDLFKSAVGKPQTMGFDEATGTVNNVRVTVFDSRGLETGDNSYDYEEFKYELKKFKQKHDIFKSPSDWIHAAVYCVPRRYQPVDCEIINGCLDDKFDVVVAMTKMDRIGEDQIESIKQQLKTDCPRLKEENIVPICSVTAVDREGNRTDQFGREMLVKAIYSGFKAFVLENLPKRCIILGKKEIDDFCLGMKQEIASHKMALVCKSDDIKWFNGRVSEFQKKFVEKTFPEIINREFCEVVASFGKLFFVLSRPETLTKPAEEAISSALKAAFGSLLGGAIAKTIIGKAALASLTSLSGLGLGVLSFLNPFLGVTLNGWAIWQLATLNDKIRDAFGAALDKFAEEAKTQLDGFEEKLRENIGSAMEQK